MDKTYKVASIGLMGIFIMLITPSQAFNGTPDSQDLGFYGMASIVQKDANGNVILEQSIHNLITDEGETFLINQVFDEGDSQAGALIGAICITNVSSGLDETATAASMSTGNTLGTSLHCITEESGGVNDGTQGTAVIGPLTFTAGTNLVADETITSIAICAQNTDDYDECNTPDTKVAFAVVDTSDVTLSGTDTVDVTYTFDITSPGT